MDTCCTIPDSHPMQQVSILSLQGCGWEECCPGALPPPWVSGGDPKVTLCIATGVGAEEAPGAEG